MFTLATEIWHPKNSETRNESSKIKIECRIAWVVDKTRSYFHDKLEMSRQGLSKLRLLDVGSCYNPFKNHQDGDIFEVVALDLCPASGFEDEIYRCDFLDLKVSSESAQNEASLSQVLQHSSVNPVYGCKEIESLPGSSFDVVVFSFFLEYLPDPKQRMKSCEKAWQLLKPGGLLFILRPDSNRVTPWGNIVYIKKLTLGLNLLGFRRKFYEKLTHLWCIGCVKMTEEETLQYKSSPKFMKDSSKVDYDEAFELFRISQDVKTELRNLNSKDLQQATPLSAIPELFEQLPCNEDEN